MKAILLTVAIIALAVPWDEQANDVDTVEVNTFGSEPRTAVIYRDCDRSIRDWRWATDRNIPEKVRPGLYLAAWNDQGKPRIVRCRFLIFTRTIQDVELTERAKLPESKRRKLH